MKRYLAPAACAVLALLTCPGSALAQLDTATCDITVTVDAIVEWNGGTAQLSSATDALVTEYQLTDDGDGTSSTGMVTDVTTWTDYTTFLTLGHGREGMSVRAGAGSAHVEGARGGGGVLCVGLYGSQRFLLRLLSAWRLPTLPPGLRCPPSSRRSR